MSHPRLILLFSGKRKCGKDYICERLLKNVDDACIIRISGPVKEIYAKEHNLDFEQLLTDGPYKEIYRQRMIEWSDDIRKKDPGYFCKKSVEYADVNNKNVWIFSDIRRKSDVQFFKEQYKDIVKIIRIECDIHVRKQRGYIFTKGIDDVKSECDLDDFSSFDITTNNNNSEECEKNINILVELINKYI